MKTKFFTDSGSHWLSRPMNLTRLYDETTPRQRKETSEQTIESWVTTTTVSFFSLVPGRLNSDDL